MSTTRPLTREMKVMGALLLTLSAVTPASSVFVIVPGIIQQAGTGALISMAAAAMIGLAMAVIYAELGSAFPMSGGEYAVFGRTLGAPVGFVFMGMNVVLLTLAPAVLSLGAADYLTGVWPNAPSLPVGVGIVAFSTLLGILNIRTNALVTGLFLAVEVIALVVLAAIGFAHPHRSIASLAAHPVVVSGGHLAASPVAMIGLATAVAIFAYNGFGATVYFGEEMHGAPRRVARTIMIALFLTVAFEFIPLLAVLIGAPDLKALITSKDPFSDLVRGGGGSGLSIAIGLGVALAIINAVIATILINARFWYSSGRDRMWAPVANVAMTRVHRRFHSPWVATLLAGVTGAAACFIPFHFLLVLNGTGVVVMYFLLCLAAVAGRRTGATAHAAYRMPLYPLPPLLGLAALGYVIYANWIDPDVGRPSLIATAVLMLIAIAYYLIMRRRRGPGWAMIDPAAEEGAG